MNPSSAVTRKRHVLTAELPETENARLDTNARAPDIKANAPIPKYLFFETRYAVRTTNIRTKNSEYPALKPPQSAIGKPIRLMTKSPTIAA